MPWKTTKLTYCGIPLRRRTLFVLTMAFAIAAVPAVSWALLTYNHDHSRTRQAAFLFSAIALVAFSLNGWRIIFKHNIMLFWEEARYLWLGSLVFVVLATWLAYFVADLEIKRGRMDYLVPLLFGGVLFAVLLVRCIRLGHFHQKKSSIVRGGLPRKHRSKNRRADSPLPEEELAGDFPDDEDGLGESPSGDTPS